MENQHVLSSSFSSLLYHNGGISHGTPSPGTGRRNTAGGMWYLPRRTAEHTFLRFRSFRQAQA